MNDKEKEALMAACERLITEEIDSSIFINLWQAACEWKQADLLSKFNDCKYCKHKDTPLASNSKTKIYQCDVCNGDCWQLKEGE